MNDLSLDEKKALFKKYAQGLEEIWKSLVDQGPENGDPLELFESAVQLCEKSLQKILQ